MKKLLSTFLFSIILGFSFGQVIWADDFSNSNNWVIQNSGVNPAGWEFTNNPSVIPFTPLSPFASTTVNNGFIFVSSEANNSADFDGMDIVSTVTTAIPVNLSSYSSVKLKIQHNFRWWFDTRSVRISADNGMTWIDFEISNSNQPPASGYSSNNPEITEINISSVAGGAAQVLVQFYYNDYDYWGWYWAIDDVSIEVLPNYDLKLEKVIAGSTGSWGTPLTYHQVPLSQLAPIDTYGVVRNSGALSQSNVQFIGNNNGGYSSNSAPVVLTPEQVDTLPVLSSFVPPSQLGSYNFSGTVGSPNPDAIPSNNSATGPQIVVTESTYARDNNVQTNGYSTEQYYEWGNIFDVFSPTSIKGVSVKVNSATSGTPAIYGAIYEIDPVTGDFVYLDQTNEYLVSIADLNNFVTLYFNASLTLEPGNSYLVVAGSWDPNFVIGMAQAAPPLTTYTIATDGTWYYTPYVPMVRMELCNAPVIANSITAAACQSYTSSSGQVYTQSGTYEESIPNIYGCDSIVTTYNLTINAADYLGTSYSVVSPSCTSPSDGSITVTLNSSGLVAGDYILISEYYSGSGSSKAVEIYNASNHSWNLDGTTYDPSSGYTIGNWRLRNNAGAIFTFPSNTVIPPYSTLVIKNPFATGLFSNYSSNVIDGSTMTLMVNLDPNDGSPTYDYDMDIATPVTGQTIIRDQSIVYPNFGTPNPVEWITLPLLSATLGSHFNAAPAGYSILWADGTAGPTLSNIAPGTYEYSVVHSSSGCVITEAPIVLDGYVYSSYSATICYGETYSWNDQEYFWPGQYEQTFTNQFGCDSVVTLSLNVNYNDIPSVAANPAFGNAPLNVAFANQTQNIGNYNFTWYFGDGSSQQSNAPFLSHIYTQGGYSDVTLVAENTQTGCVSTQFYDNLIYVIGGVSCTHSATIQETGPLSGCAGSQLTLTANTDPSFTYQWNNNGIPVNGATSSTINPTQSGNYSVTIYQNSCPVTSASVSVTIYPAPPVPLITSSGDITSCSNQSVTLSATPGYSGYAWSNGATTPTIETAVSGDYTVTVTNTSGCSTTSNLFALNASIIDPVSLCIVGMDSLTFGNRLIWEKPAIEGIDSFFVYRETSAAGIYARIGELPYEVDAIFLDQNANTAVQAYRYKLSALDTCGNETLLGDFHKTIHLTINQGVGNSWNLIWSHYEGIDFPSYNIYRGADQASMELLTTIQSNLNSYTDLNPPAGAIYYQIEIVNPNSCDPTRAYGVDVSRSNLVDNGLNSLNEEADGVMIYPNPTSGEVTILMPAELLGSTYSLFDLTGRKVMEGKIENTKMKIDLGQLSDGSYMLKIGNNKTFKLIKR